MSSKEQYNKARLARRKRRTAKKGIKWYRRYDVYFAEIPGFAQADIDRTDVGLYVGTRAIYNPYTKDWDYLPEVRRTWSLGPRGLAAAKRYIEKWLVKESAKLAKRAARVTKLLVQR